ncbi:MAG: AmmeMemoRadiSam system protein B [Treponema sp.]|nr:AmmeMemoRadiSam system protein B [Treponema sp.]
MQIRDYSLPPGWFPHAAAEISGFLSDFSSKSSQMSGSRAVIAPHAGWYYSGNLAAKAVSRLQPDAETIIVLGGHLGAGAPPLLAMEDAARTPFGHIPIDKVLRDKIKKALSGAEDRYRDNTIEVLLPMVHYFFPKANIIWLRLPEEIESFNSGKIISGIVSELNKKVNVIASTDLTHYGANYGFSPKGAGREALKWVCDVNDKNFIEAVEAADENEVLRRAQKDKAACSAGAVLGAMGFAEDVSAGNARLIEYATSADKDKSSMPDSFVGYAAMAWQ